MNPQLARIGTTLGDIKIELGEIKTELGEINGVLTSHGSKLDPLIAGAVGVGRFTALEERVSALERNR